jgi:type VI secretion system secreted protein VgrG
MVVFLQQAHRPLAVSTPLGAEALILVGFSGREAISQPFIYQLDLVADNKTAVPFEKLLGQSVTVALELPGGKRRFFNGVCSRFSQGVRDEQLTAYHMEVVPEFWLLTRSAQTRTFQHLSVPDILKQVLDGLDVSFRLQGTFSPREYCVQYRETDFNFASRLMEEEGIYYFFTHDNGSHQLVLANTPVGHPDLPNGSQLIFDASAGGHRPEDRVVAWEKFQELRSGKYTLRDYSFELPGKSLEAVKLVGSPVQVGTVTHPLKVGGNDDMELYDWPGGYAERFDGINKGGSEQPADLQKIFDDSQRTAGIRLQEELSPSLQIRGAGGCRQMVAGHKFTLTRHFNADGPYVLTGVEHEARLRGDFRTGSASELFYRNTFTCLPLALPFRPLRRTPRPVVQGTQTAVVVGPPGEEVFPDKFGRVKVQFHWDRQGKANLDSSCWVRVSQFWAGKRFGAMFIPRAGHEVLVDFLEGDPDQPVIIGSLYNADNLPHYELPKFKTLSYIKSDTTPGSKGFNELRFDDKKGHEQVFIHSQKRMDVRACGSLFETVGGNRNEVIGVRSDDKPGGNLEITVGGDHDLHVKGGMFVGIDKKLNETVKSDVVYDFEANEATMVKSKSELNAKEIIVEAASKISLKVGGNCIVIDASGITIAGTTVKINSGGFGADTSDPGIDDPNDAAAADTGEPGFLDRLRPGGHGGRHHRTLHSQHAVATPRAGEDPRMTALRSVLAQTPSGRHALEVYDRYGVTSSFVPGGGGTYNGGTNNVNLDPGDGDYNGPRFVHEMNHAQAKNENKTADINKQSRADYVNTMLNEEAQGDVQAIQAQDELAAAGHPVSTPRPDYRAYHDGYDRGVAAARAANPSATPEELDAAGRQAGAQAVHDEFTSGRLTTSNTGQSYPDYYGSAWDGAHP